MHVEFLKSFSKYAVDDRVPFVFFFIQDGYLTDNEQNIESQQILGDITTSKNNNNNNNKGYKKRWTSNTDAPQPYVQKHTQRIALSGVE